MSHRSKLWLAGVAGLMAAAILAAVWLPRSFALTAVSDAVQSLLLLSGALAFVPLARRGRGRLRFFWALIVLGLTLWLAYQLFWTYYELALRRDVPDLCAWDVVLFMHMVPLMAALGIRPQFARDEYSARVGRLDFALLLVWWFYLYVLVVMPWQYGVADVITYNRNLNHLYSAEKLVLLAGFLGSWSVSKGEWKRVFASLFAMSFLYSAASALANLAIARKTYYSGSWYDIPLFAAMASLSWIALRTRSDALEPGADAGSSAYGVWVACSSMVAMFSLPLFALWALSETHIPSRIRMFRVSFTLVAAFSMGVIILVRQRLLDRELVRLLDDSRASFEQLKRLQAQVLQSEKLASIGRLVAGAAHELNNPITALLGYSDLLLNTALNAQQRPLAAGIGQYVRRTKSLVASLISLARQAPAPKTALDLNTLARTAVRLSEPHWKSLGLEVQTSFDLTLPQIVGDSNHLLEVCLQLVNHSLHLSGERGGKVLAVSTGQQEGTCQLKILIPAAAPTAGEAARRCSQHDPEDALGLTACRGILQEHRGRAFLEQRADGAWLLCMELPAAVPGSATAPEPRVPALWQSQPSV